MSIAAQIATAVVAALLTTMIVWAFYLVARAGQGASRLKAKTVPRVFDLKLASVSRDLGWELTGTPPEAELVNCIAEACRRAGAEVARHENDQLVVYFGSRAEAKMHGLWKTDLLTSPTRLILKTGDSGGLIWLQVRIDEDFGFQMFLGPIREKFRQRYEQVFDRITQILMPEISRYNPRKMKITFGD